MPVPAVSGPLALDHAFGKRTLIHLLSLKKSHFNVNAADLACRHFKQVAIQDNSRRQAARLSMLTRLSHPVPRGALTPSTASRFVFAAR